MLAFDLIRCPRCGDIQTAPERCANCGRHADGAQ
jgi:DNA-directed RNA polymerase subunit RPC12/RpoP